MSNFTYLSDIETQPVPWLWRGYIPMATCTIVEGISGTRKSSLVLGDWAARVTSEQLMPDGTVCEAMGGVVCISYEEAASYRIKPRFVACGGDPDKFIDLSYVDGMRFTPDRDSHIDELIQACIDCSATMVVIDTIMSIPTKKRMFGYQASNELMGKLNTIAEALGVAIVLINHTARNQKPGLQSGALSQGFTNNCRSKLVLYQSENDPNNIVIEQVKSSNGPLMPKLVFTSEDGSHILYLDGILPEQEQANKRLIAEKTSDKIMRILADNPDNSYNPEWITKKCYPTKYDAVAQALGRMVESGKVAKVGYKQYQDIEGAIRQSVKVSK